ncbi:WecB/TagA/CpsF family glycosyltransferase [Palleronia caenipelagi]|uniref:WecB/TagA/CpsF family glycosyltransferase n=1 Tax=Palleronia caenipelagi TaxID=2489174 RepID=A0A547PMH6_9RHOB|nr:WecB/TagA/CpsF family glycosyltransferase [Palleronia caenipelagi]TRD15326.1 WecB/TagA/CpsF family glycosyltransferase [Palleronia caenipelagi]
MRYDTGFDRGYTAITGPIAPTRENTVELFGYTIISDTSSQMRRVLLSRGAKRCFFLNAHCANVAARDPGYRRALSRADVVLPDGIGIDIAARLNGQTIVENLNGTDFVPSLLEVAAAERKSVFLLGGRPGVAADAAAALQNRIPDLMIAGVADGYGQAGTDEDVIAQINRSNADILLVAMGVPMQELWIDRHADQLRPDLIMGVGALFDFLAGRVARAPGWMRQSRTEWVWRLMQEPKRMWRRYLIGNAIFLFRAIHHAWQNGLTGIVARSAVDRLIALGGVLALVPLFLLIAVAIKLDDGGPVFFRQIRVGRQGRLFHVWKFRSMRPDAERLRHHLVDSSDRTGICFKQANDPRVTRVGRLLRRYSLDELPQILNVLRGDMAIIGPRPALQSEVDLYPQQALERLQVKPGITGVWQVSGRADIDFDKMVDMDIAYVRSRSIMLDAILLTQTLRAVFSGRGAY